MCFSREFREYIDKEYLIKVIPKNRSVERVCLIPRSIADRVDMVSSGIKIVVAGLVIGWLKNRTRFLPSPHLFNLAIDRGFNYGCAVVAKQQGVRAFLYGNDLLVVSVERFLRPVEKGMYVAVIDPDDVKAIGIGRLVIDPGDFDRLIAEGKLLLPAVENVFDLGILLRDESYV